MQELSFKLEVFEGPLDLMLSLIQKHKLNIEDIEISILLEQFLLYLEQMQQADIEIAGEFMEMAAHLILIKSSALLPKHEAEQMKKELEGTLIEYALCKAVAERMKQRYVGADVFVRAPMDMELDLSYRLNHDPYELYEALAALSDRTRLIQLRSRPLSIKPIVAKSYVSVFTKIVYVLRRVQRGVRVELNSLYKGQSRSEQVATFLALLELSKHGHITFSEDNAYLERSDGTDDEIINETDISEDGITDES
ncbi:MAG: segregation/condensation protein A [Oscillospiraceae bacterium]|nr:segregation/condensation protein A [Oscillospiraceae bacterium]